MYIYIYTWRERERDIEDALAGRHRQTTLGKRPWPWQSAVVLGHSDKTSLYL